MKVPSDVRVSLGSVRARVTLGAVLIVAITLAAVALATLRITAVGMVREAQRAAEVHARNLAVVASAGRVDSILTVDGSGNTILQVVNAAHEVVAWSPQLNNIPPLSETLPGVGESRAMTVRIAPRPEDSVDYRVVAIGTDSPSGQIAVFAGISLTDSQETLEDLGHALFAGSALVLVVVAGASWWITGRALKPVEDIRKEVDQLTDEQLDRRVPVPTHRDEVSRLALTMNRMLDRLEASRKKQQTFVADAAHELRSPLASLRTQLEVTLAHPEGVSAEQVARDVLEDTDRLEALAVDLLRLARLDAGQVQPAVAVDLLEEAAAAVSQRRGDRVPVRLDAPSMPVAAHASPRVINQVLTNLVDNAVRHAREEVRVSAFDDPVFGPTVIVMDDGPGIDQADQQRIFERFVRLDEPRSRDQGGTGLGLAIARETARASGGEVAVLHNEVRGTHGAIFRLSLPKSEVSEAAPSIANHSQ